MTDISSFLAEEPTRTQKTRAEHDGVKYSEIAALRETVQLRYGEAARKAGQPE